MIGGKELDFESSCSQVKQHLITIAFVILNFLIKRFRDSVF